MLHFGSYIYMYILIYIYMHWFKQNNNNKKQKGFWVHWFALDAPQDTARSFGLRNKRWRVSAQEPHVVPGCSHPRAPRQGVRDLSRPQWWQAAPSWSWNRDDFTIFYQHIAHTKVLLKEPPGCYPLVIKHGNAKLTKLAIWFNDCLNLSSG